MKGNVVRRSERVIMVKLISDNKMINVIGYEESAKEKYCNSIIIFIEINDKRNVKYVIEVMIHLRPGGGMSDRSVIP